MWPKVWWRLLIASQRHELKLVLGLFLISSLAKADQSPEPPIEVICGEMIISRKPQAVKLDPITDERIPIKDGVYKSKRGWCLYKIVNGVPEEIDSE